MSDRRWWKEAVVYEVYPRSFDDSDGDGVGDLRGVRERVDYLDDLGVDVVWLCPVYESPGADNGYDISDYRAVDEEFGDMADLDGLLGALHDRDMRLVMDLVVNHTSDEHEWFRRSRADPDGAYGEFYHWVEGDPDEPPNDWESIFGGPAWSWDGEREAWYLHLFDERQPDLHWREPAVREAVFETVTWWLEKGVDGFRLDAVNLLSKAAGYPEGDPSASPRGREHFFNGPRIHDYLRALHDACFAGRDAVTVAEMGGITADHVGEYCGADGDGIDMVFQFLRDELPHEGDGRWSEPAWELADLKRVVAEWQRTTDGWVAPCLGNHDQPRTVSWWGDDGTYRRESATMLATFLLTLRGTPHVYQGEELAMKNATFDSLAELDDAETRQRVRLALESGEADSFADVRDRVNRHSRDHARTPMQWSADEHAGFTDGDPWLPVTDDYREVNVAAARADPASTWHHHRELVALRHAEDALVYGRFEPVLPDHDRVFAYRRVHEGERLLVVLNWAADRTTVPPEVADGTAAVLVGNYEGTPSDPAGATFRPYEAAVYRLPPSGGEPPAGVD